MPGKGQKCILPGLLVVVASIENETIQITFATPERKPGKSRNFKDAPVGRSGSGKVSLSPSKIQKQSGAASSL